jgi:TP901 family phage tail tape measure protein
MPLTIPTTYTAVDQYSSKVQKMANATASFASKANAAVARVDRGFRRLNKPLKAASSNLLTIIGVAGGTALISQGLRGAVEATIELDDSLAAASAKFGVFDRQSAVFKSLEITARKYGKTTRFTAGEAAEALKEMATAGFKVEQAIAGLPTVLALATATQSDIAQASEVAAKSLAAFGLRSKDPKILAKNLGEVSNVFNKLITTSGFGNLEEFLTTIGRSGATAKSAGVDIQTWGTVVAATVSEAKDASTAGTEFSNALTMLAKNSKKFKGLGVQVADDKGDFRDFLDILQDVEKQTAKMGEVQKAAKLADLFGKQGGKTIQILLARGAKDLKNYRTEIRNTGDLTAKMALFMEGSFGGLVASMKSAFAEAGISFIRNFQSEIDTLIKKVTTFLREMGGWIKKNKELIKTGVKVLVFLGKAFMWMKLLQGAFLITNAAMTAYNIVLGIHSALTLTSSLALKSNTTALAAQKIAMVASTAAQWLFNAAMTANPVGIIIVAIAALVLLLIVMTKKWKDWGASIIKSIGPIGQLISMVQSFRRNWIGIKDAFTDGGFIAGIKKIGVTILDAILMPIQQLLKLVSKIPGLDIVGDAALKIEEIRRKIGVNVDTDESGRPIVNTPAAVENVRTEQIEKIERNKLDLNINDPGRFAAFDPSQITIPGINITSTQTQ